MADFETHLVANARQFQKAASQDVPAALEDTSRALDDAVRDVERGGERMERSFREIANSAQRESKKVGDDFERNTRRGMGRAGEAVREFRGEAIQNLSEVASSFDGSIQGVADGFQGLAGGAAASLIAMGGPIAGVGFGLAGIGLIGGTLFTQLSEGTEKNKEEVGRWAQAYVAAGNTILGAAQIAAEAQALATDPERADEVKRNAEAWGVSVADAVRAMAGDQTAIELVSRNVEELNAQLTAYRETVTITNEQTSESLALLDMERQYKTAAESLSQLNANMAAGRELAQTTSDALKGIVESAGTARKEVDELGNELYTLPDDTQVLVRADTGQATLDVSAFKDDVDGVPETVTTTAIFKADTSALDQALAGYRNARVTVRADVVDRYGAPIR